MNPGTFTQIYIHVVFAVKYRLSIIAPSWEERMHKVITGIVTQKGQKMLAINGMPDHIHILVGLSPSCKLSDLVREIKKSSSQWINENGFCNGKFNWQSGYGAFSLSKSERSRVINYIRNQKQHHQKLSFKKEYRELLEELEIEFKDEFLFRALE